MRISSKYLCFLAAIVIVSAGADAQGFDPSTAIDVPSSVGHGTDLEHVDLMSGAVVVRIPLLHLKGRGIDTDIVASYTSKLWSSRAYQDPYSGYWFFNEDYATGTAGSAWSIGVPGMIAGGTGGQPTNGNNLYINLSTLHRYDGSTIALASPYFYVGPSPLSMFSYDNSYVNSPDGNLYLKNGEQILFTSGTQILEDTNGNKISCTYSTRTSCTDTLGRVITQTNVTGPTSIITYYDSNGAAQQTTINF